MPTKIVPAMVTIEAIKARVGLSDSQLEPRSKRAVAKKTEIMASSSIRLQIRSNFLIFSDASVTLSLYSPFGAFESFLATEFQASFRYMHLLS